MIQAIAAQWLVLRKRPMLKIFFGLYVAVLVMQFFFPVVLIGPASQLPGTTELLNRDAAAALRQTVQLPAAFATIFGQINGVGGLLLMVLSGAFVGSDAGWGMQRALLARQPGRGFYLAAKLGALGLLAALLVLVSVPIGVAVAWIAGNALGLPSTISATDWLYVARGMLIAWLGLLPYMLLATMWAILGRGAAAGITGSLSTWIFEISLGVVSLIQILGSFGQQIYNFSLAQSVGAWTDITRRTFNLDLGRAFGQFGFSFPALTQASIMLISYCAIFLLVSWRTLTRRDIRGPQ